MASDEITEPLFRRRVVITGMGVIAAPAQSLDRLWTCIRDGTSAAAKMTRFPIGNAPTHFAAQINDFEGGNFMDAKMARRLDYSHQYSVAAARLARDDARIDFSQFDADRVGVVEGSSASSNDIPKLAGRNVGTLSAHFCLQCSSCDCVTLERLHVKRSQH